MDALIKKPKLAITDRNIYKPRPPTTEEILHSVLESVQGLRQYQVETGNGEWDSCHPNCGECAHCSLNKALKEHGFELLPPPEPEHGL